MSKRSAPPRTVVELKAELKKLGLSVSGNKDQLIARLAGVTAAPATKRKISNVTATTGAPPSGKYDKLKNPELIAELKRRGLPHTGTKKVMIDRVGTEQRTEQKDSGARKRSTSKSPGGKGAVKSTLSPDYSKYTVKQLKGALKANKLPVSGDKHTLLVRLRRAKVGPISQPDVAKPPVTKKAKGGKGNKGGKGGKGPTSTNNQYQESVKARLPKLYDQIKPIIDNMPYIPGDYLRITQLRSNVKWDSETRWGSFLDDLAALDTTAERLGILATNDMEAQLARESKFDIKFVEFIQNYLGKVPISAQIVDKALLTDYNGRLLAQEEAERSPDQVIRFFATYSYLAYVMLRLFPRMIYYAIEAGQTQYLTDKMLLSAKPQLLALHVHSCEVAAYLNNKLVSLFSSPDYQVAGGSVVREG